MWCVFRVPGNVSVIWNTKGKIGLLSVVSMNLVKNTCIGEKLEGQREDSVGKGAYHLTM